MQTAWSETKIGRMRAARARDHALPAFADEERKQLSSTRNARVCEDALDMIEDQDELDAHNVVRNE